jgi:hypothetical protein
MKSMHTRVHLTYTEPDGWTSPTPLHFDSVAEAEQHIADLPSLIGPDAAKRRTWSISPCDCDDVQA